MNVTAARVEVEDAGPLLCELATTLESDILLAEYRSGLGLVLLYVGPRLGSQQQVETLIGGELARVLFAARRYELLPRAELSILHAEADMLADGLMEVALRGVPARPLMDLLPQAA